MDLAHHSANTGPISSDYNKQVFGNESDSLIRLNDLDMRESLAIGTNFVLALHDKDAIWF